MWLPIASVSVKKRCHAFWFRPAKVLIAFSLLGFPSRKAEKQRYQVGKRKRLTEWKWKMAVRRLKDQQIPTHFQLMWPTCFVFRAQSCFFQQAWGHLHRHFESALRGMVCRCRLYHYSHLWKPRVPHLLTSVQYTSLCNTQNCSSMSIEASYHITFLLSC